MKIFNIFKILIMTILTWFLIEAIKFSRLVFPDNFILYIFISIYIILFFLWSFEYEVKKYEN